METTAPEASSTVHERARRDVAPPRAVWDRLTLELALASP